MLLWLSLLTYSISLSFQLSLALIAGNVPGPNSVIRLQHSKSRTTKADKKKISEQFYTATTNCIEGRNGAGYLANSDAA